MQTQLKARAAVQSEAASGAPPITARVVFLVMAISVVLLAQTPVALMAARVLA